MKIWMLPANEDWICDRLVNEFYQFNSDIVTSSINDANIIWLFSDWAWKNVYRYVVTKKTKVVVTVHHIVPQKFGEVEELEFKMRDAYVTKYHVFNELTYNQIRNLTNKQIEIIPYWCNQYIWKQTDTKENLRKIYGINEHKYVIGSFQRDSEGADVMKPKLEKGPDKLADFIIQKSKEKNIQVILGGWRRDYLINRLKSQNIDFIYFERPTQKVINDLYQTLDLYPITARYEGGPQALLECGLLNVPVISTPVGIASQVLSPLAINEDVIKAKPEIPNVESMKIPQAFSKYREFFQNV